MGFIGSHIAELCTERGFNVVDFDHYNPINHWGWLLDSKYKNDMEVICDWQKKFFEEGTFTELSQINVLFNELVEMQNIN